MVARRIAVQVAAAGMPPNGQKQSFVDSLLLAAKMMWMADFGKVRLRSWKGSLNADVAV